jgi:hypothetical protein
MNYGQTNTTLGEKIVTVVGVLFLSTVVAALMVGYYLIGVA